MNLNPDTSMNNESKHRSVLRFASRAAARNVPANEVYVAVKKQSGAQIATIKDSKPSIKAHGGLTKIQRPMLSRSCLTASCTTIESHIPTNPKASHRSI